MEDFSRCCFVSNMVTDEASVTNKVNRVRSFAKGGIRMNPKEWLTFIFSNRLSCGSAGSR